MAKTTGPLFSLSASGTIGKTITYASWHGRSYVRRRVIPLNPYEADMVTARNRIRAISLGMSFLAQTALVRQGETLTDKAQLAAITPADLAWNSFFVQTAIGANGVVYAAGLAVFTALQAGEKTAWDNAAAALTPPITAAAQGNTGGGFTTSLTAGCVWFLTAYGLYAAGLYAVPGATPPTYA